MSSSLTSLVPVLDGTNYQQWASAMKLFLLSQGQWRVISKPAPVFEATTTAASASTSGKKKDAEEDEPVEELTVTTDNQEVIDEFEDLNDKAVGNIRLRLHHTIGYQFNDVDSARTLWGSLADRYAQPGFTQLFLEFKGAMNTNIPSNADPRPAIDKILAHFTRLREHKLDIPEQLKVLMLLSKAPPSMEVMIQVASREAATKNIELSEVCNGMITSWQNYGRSGSQGNQQRANKLSAVKRQDDQNPQFQQQQQQPNQQQQRGEGEW